MPPTSARDTWAALADAELQPGGFLLQRMAEGGHEVLIGISTDPRFGPMLAFGLGGRYVVRSRGEGEGYGWRR